MTQTGEIATKVPTLEESVAGLRHEMARGVDYAVVDIAWLRSVLDALDGRERLLTAALPSSMGGYPDLFYPQGYERHRNPWMAWESDVEAVLSGSSPQDQT